MAFKSFFDTPCNYKSRFDFYTQGSSPEILKNFIQTIEANKDDIEEVNLCWYLYNNQDLHRYLKKLSTQGIKVNVITIPLEGYDSRNPKKLKNLETGEFLNSNYSKYDLAKAIFAEYYHDTGFDNYKIFFFPHLYVRSQHVNKFSRGQLPYSLHIKSSYIKKKNGYLLFLSSSNLAERDLVKHESMICIEDEDGYQNAYEQFFNDIISHSINIREYKGEYNKSRNFYSPLPYTSSKNAFITAPFYFDSANKLEESLIEIIKTAKSRIIICAQHLAAFNYKFYHEYHSQRHENEERDGVLGAILKKAKEGVHTSCLSQTFAAGTCNGNKFKKYKFRAPSNSRSFVNFYNNLKDVPNIKYYVNSDLHSKYIIIDNTLIFCTFNFTPTQFIFLDQVDIVNFVHMPSLKYKGIHCEVSAYVLTDDIQIVNSFIENAENIIKLTETVKVK